MDWWLLYYRPSQSHRQPYVMEMCLLYYRPRQSDSQPCVMEGWLLYYRPSQSHSQPCVMKGLLLYYRPTVKILITHTIFVGRVVACSWVVCELSKGCPHVGYQWVSDRSSVGRWCFTTRPFTIWPTHDPQVSPVHIYYCVIHPGL